MAALSDYLENKLIDYTLRGQTWTPPATVYVGLLTAAPSDTGGGTEVTGGSYARAAVPATLSAWAGTQGAGTTVASTGTSGTTSNNADLTFTTATADWGTVTHVGIYDALTTGNLLIWGALSPSRNILSGVTAVFPSSTLQFQIDN